VFFIIILIWWISVKRTCFLSVRVKPKLVSALSETRRLFRLFRFNVETACFGVSVCFETPFFVSVRFEKKPIIFFSSAKKTETDWVSFVSVRTETKNRVRFRVHVHAKSMSMSAPSPLHKRVLTFSFGLFRFKPKQKIFVSRWPYFLSKISEYSLRTNCLRSR
jgi:hypothetical protein